MELKIKCIDRCTLSIATGFVILSCARCALGEPPREVHPLVTPEYLERMAKSTVITADIQPTAFVGLPCVIQIKASNIAPPAKPPFEGFTSKDYLRLSQEERNELQRQTTLAARAFPAFSPLVTYPAPVSLSIHSLHGEEIASHMNVSYLAFDTGHPGVRDPLTIRRRPHVLIHSAQTKTWFFDLAPWLADLEPGIYTATLRLHADRQLWWESSSVQFELKQLDDDDWKLIRAAAPGIRAPQDGRPPSAADWLDPTIDAHLLAGMLPPDAWANIAFYVLMGKAAAAQSVQEITTDLSNALPPKVRPVADAVRYELLLEGGDEQAAAELRERYERDHPELAWLMDRAAAKDGLVAQARRLLDTKSPAPQ